MENLKEEKKGLLSLNTNISSTTNIKVSIKYYQLESHDKREGLYLKVEYSEQLNEYKYYLIISLGENSEPIEEYWFSHENSVDNLNDDLKDKLFEYFTKQKVIDPYTIISEPEKLIEIPLEQTTINLYADLSQFKELGCKTLESFDGDFSNRAIMIFDKLHPGNGKNIFLGWLTLLSSVMGNPIIVIVKGDPGTGKTVITEIIKEFIPNRHIIELNNATESALFTKAYTHGENYPDKKIFYLKDLGDRNSMVNTASYRKHLRELCSDGVATREISDTNKSKEGHREMFTESLVGYPTMMYSTVRDFEIEQQETDRAVEITPNLSKVQRIKEIIIFADDPTAKITSELKKLKEEWIPKIQGIFEYLLSSHQNVLLPWELTQENYGLRDIKTVVSLTKKLAMINQHTRERIDDYIIASQVDLVLALTQVQDGGLECTRLQKVYDRYGLSCSFTRDDVVAMFKDSYEGIQASKSVHRTILKPATEDFDEEGIPLLYEETESKPYKYYFRREPSNEFDFKVPEQDYSLLEKNYPNLPWSEYHKKRGGCT